MSMPVKTVFLFLHRYRLVGVLFLLVFILGGQLFTSFFHNQTPDHVHAAGSTSAIVTVDVTTPTLVSQFSTGATHTQDDQGSNTATGKQLLSSALVFQNVFIMGWGSSDPEPSPGQYDWTTLDSSVQLMRDTGATPIISFCCSPGWMRPAGYQDDWTYLETAPDPTHVQDFANLAATVAVRYPDVKYFQVWNELKGMWSDSPGSEIPSSASRWDYERYTTLYNAVYDVVKAVRPDAKLGGPNPTNATDEFDPHFFSDWSNWLRQQPNGGATLPFGWAEWYARRQQTTDYQDLNHYNAIFAHDMIMTVESGAFYALPWGISSNNGLPGNYGITETMMTDQGQPTPVYFTLKAFKDYFGPGTQLYKATVSSPDITVHASQAKTMLVNHLGITQTVTVNGTTVNLAPYQVTVIDTPEGSSNAPTPTAPTFLTGIPTPP
jgi:hypothetical protein